MRNLSTILVFLLFNIKSNSQNIQLLVKKGSVIVSGKIIKPGKIEQLSINDDVKLLNTS